MKAKRKVKELSQLDLAIKCDVDERVVFTLSPANEKAYYLVLYQQLNRYKQK